MTVIEFKELVKNIPNEYDECPVLIPMHTDLPGVFAFEGVCPAVTEIITLGPPPNYMPEDSRGAESNQELKAFLVAPHSFHENELHQDDDDEQAPKTILN